MLKTDQPMVPEICLIAPSDSLAVLTKRAARESYPCNKIPEHVMGIINCGGLIEYIMAERAIVHR